MREIAIESRETSPEIIEAAHQGRSQLLQDFFATRVGQIAGSRAADNALNFIPGVDVVKLAAEAAFAKTLSGKELTGRDRLIYGAIAGSTLLSYVLIAAGMPTEAIVSRGSATLISTIKFGPNLFKQGIEAAKKMRSSSAEKLLGSVDSIGAVQQTDKFYNILNLELGADAK